MRRIVGSVAVSMTLALTGAAVADEGQESGIPIPPVEAYPDLNNDNVPDERQALPQSRLDRLSEREAQKLAEEVGPITPENVLNQLHKDNLKEIAMGELAVQKAQTESLRRFGERLIKDHQKADEKVRATAKDLNVTMQEPQFDEKHQAKIADLQALSGEDFDRAFLHMMDKDHTKTLFLLRKAQEEILNDAISQLVAELQPTIREHDRIASDLRGEMEMAEGEGFDLNEDFTYEFEDPGATTASSSAS